MSRWLWALLAGVVLVAIAAFFWVDQMSVLPPVSRGTTPVAPAEAPAHTAQEAPPSAPSSPSPPAAQEAAAPSAPPAAPLRRPIAGPAQQPRRPLRPRRPPKSPRLRPSSRRSLRPRLLPLRWPKHRCRRPRPDGSRRKSRAYMRPRASRSWSGPGPIPQRIASASSSGAAAAGPIGSRWTSSPRPRLSSRRRKSFSLPPSAGLTVQRKWKACSR